MSNNQIDTYRYASGQIPMVGDLVEFGTRHKRMLITDVDEDGPVFSISIAYSSYLEESLKLMVLIARHGCAEEPRYREDGVTELLVPEPEESIRTQTLIEAANAMHPELRSMMSRGMAYSIIMDLIEDN